VRHWSILILADAMKGTTRFSDFKRHLGLTAEVLSPRLDALVEVGLLQRYSQRPGQHDFVLSEMGRDLVPVVEALEEWQRRWNPPNRPPGLFALEDEHFDPLPESEGDDAAPPAIELRLLGAFSIWIGGQAIGTLSSGSERLLGFLALRNRAISRTTMAGIMWPESTDVAAGASLRSALSRLEEPTREAVDLAPPGVRLADAVSVDFRRAQTLARRLLVQDSIVTESDLGSAATQALSSELLPDWYDDWVMAEAEPWRLLRLNALEAQSRRLVTMGRLTGAAEAASAAMRVDPLRESAHAVLMQVHLAQGNQSDALRVFHRYQATLLEELGLVPTSRMSDLVKDIDRN
jgi:DNA-binding SARP family transcriptional activator/DNA-binding HxlR family transcriptional regulator